MSRTNYYKTPEEIDLMQKSGRITAEILKILKKEVKPGISTKDLDIRARELIKQYHVTSGFEGFQGFPGTLCTSINEEVVHTPPSAKRILQEGDILTLDFGVVYKGWYSDSAITVGVGKITAEAKKLISVTERALSIGIKTVKPGRTIGDIGHTVQKFVESKGFGVVRELAGHGIGRSLHEDPMILNYGKRKTGLVLKEGMVIAIEPMVTEGHWKIKRAKDRFTFVTRDGKLSAHFEHTIAVTKTGSKVLTK